jgi:hypothetical protein
MQHLVLGNPTTCKGGMTYPIAFVATVIVAYAIAWLTAKWLVSKIEARQ